MAEAAKFSFGRNVPKWFSCYLVVEANSRKLRDEDTPAAKVNRITNYNDVDFSKFAKIR